MKRKNKMVLIDGERLRRQLERRAIKPSAASTEMGFSDHYLSQVMYRGAISPQGVTLLENLYNIKPGDYVAFATEETERGKQEEPEVLYRLVYEAVYKAVKIALQEILDDDLQKAH